MEIFKTSDGRTKLGPKKKMSIYCGVVVVVPIFTPAEGILLIIGGGVISSYRTTFLEAFIVKVIAKCPRPVN
ncbi:hypothetical protein Y032_0661g1277 [Ancylostoma ceylanicum]|uniref:Uncharacterized protein n=1 Tax=Ancylostoma ceylanicum TaxID=53326 RepID=A0A016WJZ0_9BILA|nr:hypothetical protein Y032_0661g1277 [Ancylostoma ceylanicum]